MMVTHLALGYTHAGQDYADATYTITGSGSGVDVDNDFIDVRNAGISEIRLLILVIPSLPVVEDTTVQKLRSKKEQTLALKLQPRYWERRKICWKSNTYN